MGDEDNGFAGTDMRFDRPQHGREGQGQQRAQENCKYCRARKKTVRLSEPGFVSSNTINWSPSIDRRFHLQCTPRDRNWGEGLFEKCHYCKNHDKPCGPNLTKSDERSISSQQDALSEAGKHGASIDRVLSHGRQEPGPSTLRGKATAVDVTIDGASGSKSLFTDRNEHLKALPDDRLRSEGLHLYASHPPSRRSRALILTC